MENYTHSSHPDSRDSSPRSRELLDTDTPSSFDEPPPPNNKVKLMCSYGGKIQPRPHDHQLTYVGGDTKILAVDRNIKFPALMAKLSSLTNSSDVCVKYQLPGEDLDALISVTNDEDLDHMMVEYDRLYRSSPKPARLRLFLFPLINNNNAPSSAPTAINLDSKPERQWFVDALNSVQPLEGSSPHAPFPANPDFLFGLDKPYPAAKPADFPDISAKDSEFGSETGRETEIQELQRLQLRNNEQQQQRKIDEEKKVAAPLVVTHAPPAQVHSGPVPGPVSVQASLRNPGGGYHPLAVPATGTEPPPVYLIQTPSGIYQAVRPVTGPVGQQPVYFIQTPASLSHSQLAQHKAAYNGSEVGVVSEQRGGYSHVAYLPDRSALRRQAAAAPGGDGWN